MAATRLKTSMSITFLVQAGNIHQKKMLLLPHTHTKNMEHTVKRGNGNFYIGYPQYKLAGHTKGGAGSVSFLPL